MIRPINSFAASAYRVMTGVKRLGRVWNTTVLASVSCQHLIHTLQAQNWTSSHTWSGQKTQPCSLPTTTWQHPTRATSHQLHSQADRTLWHGWTVGVGTGQGCLVRTCGQVMVWHTVTRLERGCILFLCCDLALTGSCEVFDAVLWTEARISRCTVSLALKWFHTGLY